MKITKRQQQALDLLKNLPDDIDEAIAVLEALTDILVRTVGHHPEYDELRLQ